MKEEQIMKLLIAEDDAMSQIMLKAMVAKAGYDPSLTDDGLSAYEVLSKPDAPKLAILDWMMPGMDGTTLVPRLRELAPRLRVRAAAGLIAGTVPTIGTSSTSRTLDRAMVLAVLQAMHTSLGFSRSAMRPSRPETRAAICASVLLPYGSPALSAA